MTVSVWLISGVPGAGKSTVSKALCVRYSRAVHIPVDDIRHFVVSGYASPTDAWTSETTLQFAIAHAIAALRLDASAERLHPRLIAENVADKGWFAIDTSALDVEQTVDAIIARYGL